MSREAMQQALEALKDALSVCRSVSTCKTRRTREDGVTMYAQTEEWCRWVEDEVGPKVDAAGDALIAALAEQAQPVADAARVIEWATSTPRKAAVNAFTEGPERQAAYWIEWAEARVVNRRLTTEQAQPVACHVFNVTVSGRLHEWEPTTFAFTLKDGKHALYTAPPAPVHQPVHGWTNADADAARLALELECLLTDKDVPMSAASRWWDSAHEALRLHRERLAAAPEAPTPPAPVVPPGWRMVPVEPTKEMVEAGYTATITGTVCGQWAAMLAAAPGAPAPVVPQPLTEREVELIDGMIEVQLRHAAQCDLMLARAGGNHTMAVRQKGWDMERVELLRKIRGMGEQR